MSSGLDLPRTMEPPPSARRIPRLAFVGVGWIGLNRLEAARELTPFEVVAIVDASPEQRERARQAAPDAMATDRLDDALASAADGVVIATPSALHAGQVCLALDAGKAVFCQKPLARTESETRQVIAAAQRADRLLGVDFSYRYVRGLTEIRELVRSGALGTVFAADLTFHNAYGPDKPWFYDARQSGGGCLIDLGTHLVDLAHWVLGTSEIQTLSSRLYQQGRRLSPADIQQGAVEDYAAISWESGGSALQLSCSWRLSAGCDAKIEAAFYGTQGGVRLRNVDGSFYDFVVEHMTGTQTRTLASPPDPWGGRCLAAWCRQLAGSGRYDPAIESTLDVARLLDCCYGRAETPRGKATGEQISEGIDPCAS